MIDETKIEQNSIFIKVARIVKEMGEYMLPNQQTLSDALMVEKISMWDVVAPMLSVSKMPKLFNGVKRHNYYIEATLIIFKIIKLYIRLYFRKPCSNNLKLEKDNKILILAFSRYMYRDTLKPIAKALAKSKNINVVLLNNSDDKKIINDSDEFFSLDLSIWDYYSYEVKLEVINEYKKYIKKSHLIINELENIAKKYLLPNSSKLMLKWLFLVYIPNLIVLVILSKKIINESNLRVLISPDVHDPRVRIFCLMGKRFGVKTVEVQHVPYTFENVEWRFFIADLLAVTGLSNYDVMINHGIQPEKMIITGSPRYDNEIDSSNEVVKARFGITKQKKIILFGSQPYLDGAFSSKKIREQMIVDLLEIGSKFDNIVLLIKDHPLETLLDKKIYLGLRDKKIKIELDSVPIQTLIEMADVYITFFSATTFDAIALNRAVVNIMYKDSVCPNLFENSKATFIAKNKSDIEYVFRCTSLGKHNQLLIEYPQCRRNFFDGWYSKSNITATHKIVNIILEIIE